MQGWAHKLAERVPFWPRLSERKRRCPFILVCGSSLSAAKRTHLTLTEFTLMPRVARLLMTSYQRSITICSPGYGKSDTPEAIFATNRRTARGAGRT